MVGWRLDACISTLTRGSPDTRTPAPGVAAHGGALTTKQLCLFLAEHVPEVPRLAAARDWRNGIRHALSSHAAFTQSLLQPQPLQPWHLKEALLPRTAKVALAHFRTLRARHPSKPLVSSLDCLEAIERGERGPPAGWNAVGLAGNG
jgi:hypothetical protein